MQLVIAASLVGYVRQQLQMMCSWFQLFVGCFDQLSDLLFISFVVCDTGCNVPRNIRFQLRLIWHGICTGILALVCLRYGK